MFVIKSLSKDILFPSFDVPRAWAWGAATELTFFMQSLFLFFNLFFCKAYL